MKSRVRLAQNFGISVGKVRNAGDIAAISQVIGKLETRAGLGLGTVHLVPWIETAEAIVSKIARDEIEDMKKQPISLMPSELQKSLTAENLVDVVEYLTTLKKSGS